MAVAQHTDPAIIAGLEMALREYGGGTHTLEDVIFDTMKGNAQLWKNDKAVLVTQLVNYPRGGMVLNLWLASGEYDAVHDLSDEAIGWARARGCKRATITGRRGWARTLKDEGWELLSITLTKDISDG